MDHTNYKVEPMISAKSIAARCEELAKEISLASSSHLAAIDFAEIIGSTL